MTVMSNYHNPVMLQECIDALAIKPDGIYVDVTYGGGGHSRAILDALGVNGKLFAFDQDDDALAQAIDDDRLVLIKSNFRFIANYLNYFKAIPVDGVLADLGISSYQIDEKNRGFAFMQNGPLDMRMDKTSGIAASEWLAEVSMNDLVHILSAYGEVKNAKTLAQAIKKALPMNTTAELAEVCKQNAPKNKHFAYAAKVFQAIRIQVNDEMEALKSFLLQLPEVMAENGRLVVMSYHSLEDRLVKRFIQAGNLKGDLSKDMYGNVLRPFKEINKKPILASVKELEDNSRARSAKLRVALKGNYEQK